MSHQPDVLRAIEALVRTVNEGDFTTATRAFVEDATIVEDIAPYRWAGPDAPARWLAAMAANAALLGVTGVTLELAGEARVAT